MPKPKVYASAAAALLSLGAATARADVALPRLMSDGMVLQQKTPVRIFGKADPGEKVTVAVAGQKAETTAGPNGEWVAVLKPIAAGGPYTLTVSGKNTVTIKDVLVGEVWVASGQSNMEFAMDRAANAATAIPASADPQLRMFTVPRSAQPTPQYDVTGGRWEAAAPDTTGHFSAVGYFFAKALRQSLGVPVGIIHTSWGGTRIEAWTSRQSLVQTGLPASQFDALVQDPAALAARQAEYDKQRAAWVAAGSPAGRFVDPGIADTAKGWSAPDLDTAGWAPIALPGLWETRGIGELAYLDGAVWMRRDVTLPADWDGKAATLNLGAIDDGDTTFVNGTQVGATSPDTPNAWSTPRHYAVPAGVLKAGRNVIAVRVWDGQGGGGFGGPAAQMTLAAAEGAAPVALTGDWLYKVENGRPGEPGPLPTGIEPNTATALYNGMLWPVTKYTIKGAIWYQGEANAFRTSRYDVRMPAMIENWRADFGIKDFPFFMVALAPYANGDPTGDSWPWLRETQFHTTKVVKNAGVAVIDTESGTLNDIHPPKKQPVGERLALLARQIAYGQKVEGHSPEFKSFKVEGGTAVVTFDHAGSGLEARPVTGENGVSSDGASLVGFALAGADGKFYPATAVVRGKDAVAVSSPQVPQPAAVRYGWANYYVTNLWSKDGLPAAPFRTDSDK